MIEVAEAGGEVEVEVVEVETGEGEGGWGPGADVDIEVGEPAQDHNLKMKMVISQWMIWNGTP